MRFWDKLKRKKTNVPSGEELKKGVTQVPFENFLADLIASGTNYLLKLNRIGTSAAGEMSGTIPVNTVSPSTLTETISEKYGGGSYEIRFMDHDQGDALLMRKDDATRPVMYIVNVAGEPKGKKEGSVAKGLTMSLPAMVQTIFKPEVMTALAGFWNTITGQSNKQADPAAMMQQLTQTLVQLKGMNPEPEAMNPIALMESLMGLLQKFADQMKPPPTTTAGGGNFIESLARGLAPALSGMVGGATPQQIPQSAGSPGFAGAGSATAEAEAPPDPETINPLKILRSMVASRQDPDQVAAYAVEAIDTYSKFSTTGDVPSQYRNLLDNPGIAIDFLLSFVPNVDDVYAEQVKAAAIRYVEAWKAQNQGEAEPTEQPSEPLEFVADAKSNEEADVTNLDTQTDTDEPPEVTEDTGEGGPGNTEDDANPDPDGEEHG